MKNRGKAAIILLLFCAIIAIIPLVINKDTEFSGTDGAAEGMVNEINPDYVPWIENIIKLPGDETESLLFSLQAAFGALIIGYGFGYLRARKKYE